MMLDPYVEERTYSIRHWITVPCANELPFDTLTCNKTEVDCIECVRALDRIAGMTELDFVQRIELEHKKIVDDKSDYPITDKVQFFFLIICGIGISIVICSGVKSLPLIVGTTTIGIGLLGGIIRSCWIKWRKQ